MAYLKSLRFHGMVVAGGWCGYGLYVAVMQEPVAAWIAALLAFLLSHRIWADARKQ